MSNDTVIRLFRNRPFVPYQLYTVDGRQFEVRNPEQVSYGGSGDSVLYMHPDLRLEVIECRHIVSFATLRAATFEPAGD